MRRDVRAEALDRKVNGGVLACLILKWYRRAQLGSLLHAKLYKLLSVFLHSSLGCAGANRIGAGLRLPHPYNIIVSDHSLIGANCTIFHNVTLGSNEREPYETSAPVLGDGVYVGAGAVLIGPIRVGDGARIGAGAVVTKDVPAGATAVGVNRIISPSGDTD